MGAKRATWDYIIIGAGSAGCVLADRLSEDRTTAVLLLEAGSEGASPFIRFPAGVLKIKAKYNWRYEAEPDPSRNGTVEAWPAGRVLGGSSSINVTTWTRGHRGDYDHWSSLGCTDWDYQHVLPYFRKGEHFVGGPNTYRGEKGPQYVSFTGVDHPLMDAFVHSAEQRGVPYNADLNGALQEGVGYNQVSQRRGLRDSTATSYLAEARHRRNLTLHKHAFVTRIIIENNRAIGVEYRLGDKTQRALADREVVLSAGSIASPKLLMLSGVGPADELTALGIQVLCDSPGVGKNLQEHPVASFAFSVNQPTLNTELDLKGIVKHGADFLMHGRGGATVSGSTAVGFVKLDEAHARPDIEINFRPLAVARVRNAVSKRGGEFADMKPMKIQAVQSGAWLCHPTSRGTVSLRSSMPDDRPIIRHTLFGGPEDIAKLTAGCRLIRDIFAQDAFRPYVTGELEPGPSISSDSDWEAYLRGHARQGHHPIGTCKMGTDDLAVVDPHLRVRGIEGLRVVDASVMPELISGHTNAPTIMIGERGADFMRGDQTMTSR